MSEDAAKLLQDEDLRRSFGKRGRELATSRYGTEMIIPQYIKFYEKVLENHK